MSGLGWKAPPCAIGIWAAFLKAKEDVGDQISLYREPERNNEDVTYWLCVYGLLRLTVGSLLRGAGTLWRVGLSGLFWVVGGHIRRIEYWRLWEMRSERKRRRSEVLIGLYV